MRVIGRSGRYAFLLEIDRETAAHVGRGPAQVVEDVRVRAARLLQCVGAFPTSTSIAEKCS